MRNDTRDLATLIGTRTIQSLGVLNNTRNVATILGSGDKQHLEVAVQAKGVEGMPISELESLLLGHPDINKVIPVSGFTIVVEGQPYYICIIYNPANPNSIDEQKRHTPQVTNFGGKVGHKYKRGPLKGQLKYPTLEGLGAEGRQMMYDAELLFEVIEECGGLRGEYALTMFNAMPGLVGKFSQEGNTLYYECDGEKIPMFQSYTTADGEVGVTVLEGGDDPFVYAKAFGNIPMTTTIGFDPYLAPGVAFLIQNTWLSLPAEFLESIILGAEVGKQDEDEDEKFPLLVHFSEIGSSEYPVPPSNQTPFAYLTRESYEKLLKKREDDEEGQYDEYNEEHYGSGFVSETPYLTAGSIQEAIAYITAYWQEARQQQKEKQEEEERARQEAEEAEREQEESDNHEDHSESESGGETAEASE